MAYRPNVFLATNSSGNFVKDFQQFLGESTILETATAIIIGNAFKGIVDSFVSEILTPVISLLLDNPSKKLEDLYLIIGDVKDYRTIDHAEAANANIVRYGLFLKGVLNFVLQALVVFAIIRIWTRVKKMRV